LIVKLRDPADTVAWREFLAIYEPFIYRLASRKGLQDADARDLCQEVFCAVAGAIEHWTPSRGSFRAWLSRIARNLLINALTRRPFPACRSGGTSVQEFLEAQPGADMSATALVEREYRKHLFCWAAAEVREQFTPATWRAFWETAVEGRLPNEIAAELRISVGAVYIARSRVLSRLKQRIEQLGDAEPAIREADHENPI
jgi:RNA polymerase sigma-70 factor (ECF subfamily)